MKKACDIKQQKTVILCAIDKKNAMSIQHEGQAKGAKGRYILQNKVKVYITKNTKRPPMTARHLLIIYKDSLPKINDLRLIHEEFIELRGIPLKGFMVNMQGKVILLSGSCSPNATRHSEWLDQFWEIEASGSVCSQ